MSYALENREKDWWGGGMKLEDLIFHHSFHALVQRGH